MKKYYKLLLTVLICLIFVLTLIACVGATDMDEEENPVPDGDNSQEETFLSREEVEAGLTNYSFKYSYIFNEDGEITTTNFVDMRSEHAWLLSTEGGDDTVTYIANKSTDSLYMLYKEDNSGMVADLDEDFESFSGWGTHLFAWYDNMDDLVKKGTDTVAGRLCGVYEHSFGTIKYKYFIDKEYDMCLKFEVTESSTSMKTTFAFTEFTMGGVETEEIMSFLEGYQIDDYRIGN